MAKEVKETKTDLNLTNNLLNKIFIVLVIIACILAINTIIISVKGNISSNYNNTEENLDYDVSMFKEINASDLTKETKNKARVLYIGRSSCSWCTKFLPALQKAQDEIKYTTLYIDIAKIIDYNTGAALDQDSIDLLTGLATTDDLKAYMDENFGATPMVLVIKDSKIIAAQTGYVEYDTLKSFLNENGFK